MVAVEWEGVQKGGVFEGLGMNEEGRRALGRGETNSLPSTVSWNCMSSLSTPHVFISFPRHRARHGVLALDQTTCLVRFSVYIVYGVHLMS